MTLGPPPLGARGDIFERFTSVLCMSKGLASRLTYITISDCISSCPHISRVQSAVLRRVVLRPLVRTALPRHFQRTHATEPKKRAASELRHFKLRPTVSTLATTTLTRDTNPADT